MIKRGMRKIQPNKVTNHKRTNSGHVTCYNGSANSWWPSSNAGDSHLQRPTKEASVSGAKHECDTKKPVCRQLFWKLPYHWDACGGGYSIFRARQRCWHEITPRQVFHSNVFHRPIEIELGPRERDAILWKEPLSNPFTKPCFTSDQG